MGNKSSSSGIYDFIYYVRWGHIDEVKRYLRRGGITNDKLREALCVACEYNRLEIAKNVN